MPPQVLLAVIVRLFYKAISLLLLFGVPGSLWAAEYYGSVLYSDSNTGVAHIVFQSADSKKLCLALNKNYWRGLRTSCPQCKLELSGCDTKLPSAYRYIFNDRPITFPYVSAPYTRIIILGVPLEQAKAVCQELAQRWRKGMNQPAKCVSR